MIRKCSIIELPKISDHRGHLTFIEQNKHIPFQIQRVYYLYNVPNQIVRGGHAHKELHQLFLAISGSFDIAIDDGNKKEIFHLNRADQGLYVRPMLWRDLYNFSTDAVCIVLASNVYNEEDYYRNYDDFIKAIEGETLG